MKIALFLISLLTLWIKMSSVFYKKMVLMGGLVDAHYIPIGFLMAFFILKSNQKHIVSSKTSI